MEEFVQFVLVLLQPVWFPLTREEDIIFQMMIAGFWEREEGDGKKKKKRGRRRQVR